MYFEHYWQARLTVELLLLLESAKSTIYLAGMVPGMVPVMVPVPVTVPVLGTVPVTVPVPVPQPETVPPPVTVDITVIIVYYPQLEQDFEPAATIMTDFFE